MNVLLIVNISFYALVLLIWLSYWYSSVFRKHHWVRVGDIVNYVLEFDAEKSGQPNIRLALVKYKNKDKTLNLLIPYRETVLVKDNIIRGNAITRNSWFPK